MTNYSPGQRNLCRVFHFQPNAGTGPVLFPLPPQPRSAPLSQALNGRLAIHHHPNRDGIHCPDFIPKGDDLTQETEHG